MTLKTRFSILMLLLAATVAGAFVLLQISQRDEAADLMDSLRAKRALLLERVIDVTGQPLRQLASDYSLWDDMVAFVARPDPAWAKVNINASLDNFSAIGAWVLKTDGTLVYDAATGDTPPALPMTTAELAAHLAANPFANFFFQTKAGLVEIRTGPIQPSDDIKRTSPPLGWLVVAKLWDPAFLQTLSKLTESKVSLSPPVRSAANSIDLELDRPLPDWKGRPAANLHLRYHPAELVRMLDYNIDELALLAGTGALLIGLMAWGLYWLVLRPLGFITASLSAGRPAPLAPLESRPDEFGRLAGLVRESFEQQGRQENEIEERRRAEMALLESKAALRRTLDERVRLGRDLHDGVIQSLYAAGLSLAHATTLLPGRPDQAAPLVESSRLALAATIREVRRFITGLEPEDVIRRRFRDSVSSLFSNYQHLRAGALNLDVDDALADGLPLACRADLLQIIREAVSNALRHGRASQVYVRLQPQDGLLVLSVTDNGAGFDPSASRGDGHGLRNLEARATGLGARLDCQSAPGKGTRITVTFPIPHHAHDHETDENPPHPAG